MMRVFLTVALTLLLASAASAQNRMPPAANRTPAAGSQPPAVRSDTPAEAPAADDGGEAAQVQQGSSQLGGSQAPIPFEGGAFTITQQEEFGKKTLAYDGREIASNYSVSFDKTAKIGETNVALFDVGDGGNACGPAKVIAWRPQDGAIQSVAVGQDDCGAPAAAIGDYAIYFVPYLLPGETRPALQWSPDTGLTTAGTLAYAPEPGTGWSDINSSGYQNIIDAFRNEAVYEAARKLLGSKLTAVTTGLLVGGGTETTSSGVFYASGCVPHACGSADAFMAVDASAGRLYFAQEGEAEQSAVWPPLRTWPREVRAAMTRSLGD